MKQKTNFPSYQDGMLPLLQLLADQEVHDITELTDKLSDYYKLTNEEKLETLNSSGQTRMEHRTYWSRSYLKEAGLLEGAGTRKIRITNRGLKVLAESPRKIDFAYLRKFPEFIGISPSNSPKQKKTKKAIEFTFHADEVWERIQVDYLSIQMENDDKQSYLFSYPAFLKYFENLNVLTKQDVIIGVHALYGWMPTILTLYVNDKSMGRIVELLNYAKRGLLLSFSELQELKSVFNHSIVGTSKLLHCINPSIYPIWDSRVCCYLNHHKKTDDSAMYLSYLDLCRNLTSRLDYEPIHKVICEKVGYEMTKIRTIEMIMFASQSSNFNTQSTHFDK